MQAPGTVMVQIPVSALRTSCHNVSPCGGPHEAIFAAAVLAASRIADVRHQKV